MIIDKSCAFQFLFHSTFLKTSPVQKIEENIFLVLSSCRKRRVNVLRDEIKNHENKRHFAFRSRVTDAKESPVTHFL